MTLVDCLAKLYLNGVVPVEHASKAHQQSEIFLDSYLDKSRKNIGGQEFAQIVKLLGDAKFDAIYTYNPRIVLRLEKDFVSYQAENSHFTVTDLYNLLISFDRISELSNMTKLMSTILDKLQDSIKNSDTDMLKLFRLLHRLDVLSMDQYESL